MGGRAPARAGQARPPRAAAAERAGRPVPPPAWSLPAALGFAAGCALGGLGAPLWAGLPALLAALRLRRGPWLLALLLLPAGQLRYAAWEARPAPLAPLLGQERVWSGVSDGRVLRLDAPADARAALAPAGAVPPGRARLRGRLEPAPSARNPGGFDYAAYLRRRGIGGQLFVSEVLEHAPARGPRARARAAVGRGLPPEAAALMEAMTLGVRDRLGDLRERFAAAGLAHVLALSGLHVGVLVAALERLLRPLGRRRYGLLLAALGGYLALVGSSPSVLRAALMVAVALLGLWRGVGRLAPGPILALAALATLVLEPSWLFDLSFQLSYGAVLGILLVAPPVLARLLPAGGAVLPPWSPRLLAVGGATVSAAAQAFTLPLVADAFGRVPLLSPLVNVVAVPLAGLLVPLGFAAAALGALWPPLAGLVNLAVRPLAGGLIALADLGAALPAVPWGEVAPRGHLLYALGALPLLLALHGRLRPRRALLVAAAAAAAASLGGRGPEIVILDVGQGDAALIRLPGRREVLVDGGGTPFSDFDVGARTVLPALRALGVDELELVIASHADTDHMEGLAAVLRGVRVHELAVGHPAPEKRVYRELVAAAAERGVPLRELRRGETLVLGDARLEILHPTARRSAEVNADSVAFVLRWRGRDVALFLGDAPAEVERALAVPDVEMLMVAHHGSATSTSPALLRAARPELAVVSVGRNHFGHPAAAVLARLREAGAAVRLTRDAGAVRVPLAGAGSAAAAARGAPGPPGPGPTRAGVGPEGRAGGRPRGP